MPSKSVALFNPSIVPALIQEGVPPGAIRFLMSLRAIGEGHLSSIVFRTGVIDAGGDVQLDPPGPYSQTLKATLPDQFKKVRLLARSGGTRSSRSSNFNRSSTSSASTFHRDQLSQAIDAERQSRGSSGIQESTTDAMISLTRVNYQLHLSHAPVGSQAEIVIFPFSDIERHGIEDLRMVRFTEDDGTAIDYGTFTAFNGERVFPQLMEFRGESTIDISLITGDCAKNKGMALFPRRVRGKYAMISRIDNENLYFMESDDILVWDQARVIEAPKFLWQVMQIGNCGSPIETEAGWLLLDPWSRTDAPVLHRGDVARSRRSLPRHRPDARAVDHAHRRRTAGLRSQRRLFVRRVVAQSHADHPLRSQRPVDDHGSRRSRRLARSLTEA